MSGERGRHPRRPRPLTRRPLSKSEHASRRPSTPLAAFSSSTHATGAPSSCGLASDAEWLGDLRTPFVQRSPIYSREETVAYEPPTHYAYRILSGQPVKAYRADVDLTPVDAGTRIRWSFRVEPKVPGTGAFMRFYLGRIVAGLARRLAAYAEKQQ
ncbi:MAG: SRPBCC family protein, partial [Actinobacteria bacterium]